ncbi:zf-HC2 domain-containing protein [Saccharopolyspora sp. NPDC002376]
MTVLRGWGLPEQHLALDAIVAFVDGELSPNANDRAAAHLARCPACTADAAAQRQARAAVKAAGTPSISPKLLQALQAIPGQAELPSQPEGLALTEDGQLVTVSRPDRANRFGTGPVLGSTTPLGGGQQLLGSSHPFAGEPEPARRMGRRTKQGAGVVFSGLMLGALALMNLPADEDVHRVPGIPAPQPGERFAVVPASTHDSQPPEATGSSEPPAPMVATVAPSSSGEPAPTTTAGGPTQR